jgi:hypothetical protein
VSNIVPYNRYGFKIYRGELYLGGFKLDADYGLYKLRRDGTMVLVSDKWDPTSGFPLTEYRGELYFPSGDQGLLKVERSGSVIAAADIRPTYFFLGKYYGQLYFWGMDYGGDVGVEFYELGPVKY